MSISHVKKLYKLLRITRKYFILIEFGNFEQLDKTRWNQGK
jgi:hypothetical protein